MKKVWLIKAGGEMVGSRLIREKIIKDILRLRKKYAVVLLHGGGPQIEQELTKANIPHEFKLGRRVTSPEAMIVVERVLSGEINKGLVGELNFKGIPSVGLSCRDGNLVIASPIPGLGRAAKPVKINTHLLKALISNGFSPVISSVGSDSKGNAVNINADDAASAIGQELKVDNLVFLTNVPGVLDQNKKRIPILRLNKIDGYIKSGVVTGGMIPKIQSARMAILKGIKQVTITNGNWGIQIEKGTQIIK
ncbi:MAG: acetylglutamate kinase [Elusimicrobiota bacterium]